MQLVSTNDSLEMYPETINDLITLYNMIREHNGLNTIEPVIVDWITDYWAFVQYNEHGNECSIGELWETDFIGYAHRFLKGEFSLNESSEWTYLTECADYESYDSVVFDLMARALALMHKYAKTL